MYVLLIGAPGSGKGTQAKLLKEILKVEHISTGDLLRRAVAEKTPLGEKATAYMAKGELVLDSVIIGVLEEALQHERYAKGFLLDGYPRNLNQAKTLDALLEKLGLTLDKVLYFNIPLPLLEERLTGRRVSSTTGKEYHVKFHPPKLDGVCDLDGAPLIQRPDDQPDKVKFRLEVFQKETVPVVEHYKKKGLVAVIESAKTIPEVQGQIMQALQL